MWINRILKEKSRIFALSPMADMTDSAFCQIVRRIGGADIVFREMVSSEAVIRHNEKTLGMIDFVEAERPIVQQIFGANPQTMAKAASIVMEHARPEGIDINMGCPVYKITSNFNGAALMKEPLLAAKIIREMKRAIGRTPLSVKIRLGWNDPDTFKTFIPIIEEAGADLITMHGRTKAQGYSGKSDLERLRQAARIATVPFFANGDIHEPEQVKEVLDVTGAQGVLIARGALGNPWFFKIAAESLGLSAVSLKERVKVVREHAQLHCRYRAWQYSVTTKKKNTTLSKEEFERATIVSFRKHLSWYFKTNKIGFEIPGIKEMRGRLVRVGSLQELYELLDQLIQNEDKGDSTNSVLRISRIPQ